MGLRSNAKVNPSTHALELEIPLGGYPGRAGNAVPVSLYYSSKVWRFEYVGYNPDYGPGGQDGPGPSINPYSIIEAKYAEHSRAGWTSSLGMPFIDPKVGNELYTSTGSPVGSCDPPGSCWSVGRLLVHMPDGSAHELRAQDDPKNCAGVTNCWPGDYYAVDGSRLRYNKPSQTLYLPDGSYYRLATGEYFDRNGNKMTSAAGGWTDTLGRPIPAPPMSQTPGELTYSLPGVGGTSVNYTFVWRYLSDTGVLTTPEPLRYICDRGVGPQSPTNSQSLFYAVSGSYQATYFGNGAQLFNPVVLYQIVLPTNQAYTFTYDAYGEIDKVTLPTGGYERYSHGGKLAVSPASSPYGQANRGVVERRVSAKGDGSDEVPWFYSQQGTANQALVMETTAPDNTLTQTYLYMDLSVGSLFGYSFDGGRDGMPFKERVYSPPDASNNNQRRLRRRKLTEWSSTGTNGADQRSQQATRNARVTRAVEIILDTAGDALTKTTAYGYDLTNQFTTGVNQTSVSEYDYVSMPKATAETAAVASIPLPASQPLRITETAYLDAANPSYRSLNILGLPTSVTVKDGSGAAVAQTTMAYDEAGYQFGNTYGAMTTWADPGALRGNVTTVSRWLDTTGGYLQTHAKYDQCGSVVVSTDASGNETQTAYSPAYAYAYPTSVTTAAPNPDAVSDSGLTFQPGSFGSTTGLTAYTDYDSYTGLVTTTTDANGKRTTYDYSDPLNRLKMVTRPDGGTTSYGYGRYTNDGRVSDYVSTATALDTGRAVTSYQYFDGLGRPSRSFLSEGGSPAQFITIETMYDNRGRVWKVSNPHRTAGSDESMNQQQPWTTTDYDDLGRVKKVTTPDGAEVTTAYTGTQVTVTDQAGKKRSSVSDALGRLAQVTEDPTVGGLNYVTAYSYDVLGNLRKVDQGGQQRFFKYDSLSRLTRAKNPEQSANAALAGTDPITGNGQWSLSYAYDANGNLQTRTDARGITTNYKYDHLNRNIITSYASDPAQTPPAYRHYDNPATGKQGLGRFWWNTTGASATGVGGYDAAGRVLEQHQNFLNGSAWSADYSVKLEYNLAGGITSQTYPSGHAVTYNYDAAGRPGDNGVQPAFRGYLGDGVQRTYADQVSYNEFGGVRQERFGTQTPLYHKLRYNTRGQLYNVRLSTGGDAESWNRGMLVNHYGSLDYANWGASGPNDNGNLLRSHHYVPNSEQADLNNPSTYKVFYQDYEYDALNRVTKVTELNNLTSGAQYGQKFDYDRFGNRTINQGQTLGAPGKQFDLNPAGDKREVAEPSNRLYAAGDNARLPAEKLMRYDAAGNLVYDSYSAAGGGARMYDAENRMTAAVGTDGNLASYTYDADGRRVRRKVANEEWWQVYGVGGELVAEYRAGAATYVPSKEYGYRGGELLVTMASGDDLRLRRFAQNLYYGALRRDPTAQELSDTTNQLAAAGAQGRAQLLQNAKEVARALFTPTGYELSPYRTDGQYVSDLYYTYLQRAPDDWGLGYWSGAAAGGAGNRSNVCDALQESAEFAAVVSILYGAAGSDDERTDRFIQLFYLAATGAPASASDLQQKRATLNATAAQGPEAVKAAAESMGRALFSLQVADTSLPAQQFVTNLYEGFLQRGPDANGLANWTTQAGTTVQSRQHVLDAFAVCDPFKELAGALYREAFWLVPDHLGTPRMVADKSGSLAGIRRHDYLPYGEELFANTGGRTLAQGYVGDSNRFKFVGHERDGESGLDFAGARYCGPIMGRFLSVDALMSSGTLRDPQTWNRYSYAINNPLKWTDPDGLYIWSGSLGGNVTDEELRRRAGNDRDALRNANSVIAKRNEFRNALTAAGGARDALPADRNLVSGALASYGAEGTANGVTVGQGRLADGVAAEARVSFQTDGQAPFTTRANVEVILSDRDGGNLTVDVAHEGRHAADAQDFAAAFSAEVASGGDGHLAVAGDLNRTRYEREVRGYTVSSLVAQGLGLDNLSVGRREIWNRGWAQADRATLRSAAIDNHLRESPTYHLTPNTDHGNPGPGPRYFPRP